ncbi:diacylglycerol kinase family lipid kinase [Candidatus Falkowbacteria bacterium]|nr:diacylglycerol kinase family lipid kinase [Candidatus Falkowbacteria bacterium]
MTPENLQNNLPDARWYVVVNPNAGNRKIARDWEKIQKMLELAGFDFEYVLTERMLQAIALTTQAAQRGFRRFIAVGGDGTFNEVVNGIFMQTEVPALDFTVAIIPVGTGNDWGRMFSIPADYQQAIDVIKQGKTFVQDVGVVTYRDNGSGSTRYFVNIAGMGFDAMVAQKTNQQKAEGKGNAISYFINLFTSLFEYKPRIIEVTIDSTRYSFNIFSMSVGICRFNGGGMKQLPRAIPDDGLLDITVIKKIGLGTLLAQLRNLYTGTFIKHPKVAIFTARKVTVQSRKKGFMMEADGESLGEAPLEITLLPRALRTIIHTAPSPDRP